MDESRGAMTTRKLVTFDAFGTLFSTRQPIHETYARIAAEHGYRVQAANLQSAFRKEQSRRKPRYGITDKSPRQDYNAICRDWWTDLVTTAFLANGVGVSDTFCHELYSHYSTADTYTLFDDVMPCLKRLSRAGVVIGVISDFDERLEGILRGLGVSSHITFIVQSFVEGYGKPSEKLWTAAVAQAGERVDEGWHVGDDPEKDAFEDPTTFIVDRSGTITTEFQKVSSLEQLPALLNVP